MKKSLALATVLAAFAHPVANGASVAVVKTGTAYSLYLNGGVNNGNIDAIGVKLSPLGAATFTNQAGGLDAGIPKPAGQPFSYRNRYLDGDLLDGPGFMGWVILDPKNTPTGLSFDGGPLGKLITTANQPGGNLFLANVNMPSGRGMATVQVLRAGTEVGGSPLTVTFGVPEPATFVMASLSILTLAGAARRLASA